MRLAEHFISLAKKVIIKQEHDFICQDINSFKIPIFGMKMLRF